MQMYERFHVQVNEVGTTTSRLLISQDQGRVPDFHLGGGGAPKIAYACTHIIHERDESLAGPNSRMKDSEKLSFVCCLVLFEPYLSILLQNGV